MSALSCLNIFGAALDAWDDYRLAKYQRNKETKEWLETHVSLLRMDMANMDKTSAEYMKLVDIIKAQVTQFNESGKKPYEIHFSMGYSIYQNEHGSIDDFIKKIDASMYEDKKRRIGAGILPDRRHHC